MNMPNGIGNGIPYIPFLGDMGDNESNNKTAHDSYEVYVNGDYVGQKESIAVGDGGSRAVDDYLKSRKFDNYKIEYEGKKIYIEVQDENEENSIKNHLSVYLDLR